MDKVQGRIPSLPQAKCGDACNPSTQEMEARESDIYYYHLQLGN